MLAPIAENVGVGEPRGSFDPEQLAIICEAFDVVIAKLSADQLRREPRLRWPSKSIQEEIAAAILHAAAAGENDCERLVAIGLAVVQQHL